jgi:hypothetical protein
MGGNQTQRERLKAEYGRLYDAVAAALFRDDPMGIKFETNTDEYEPEVDTILPRLRGCHSAAEVQTVIHEEFAKWFGPDSVGRAEDYRAVAEEVWRLWHAWKR